MTGTKFGCGAALCGACTVHLDGEAIRSCVTPISAAAGQKITTIEAVRWQRQGRQGRAGRLGQARRAAVRLLPERPGDERHRAAAGPTRRRPTPTSTSAMSGNICRCGTYQRIRAAIKDAAKHARLKEPPCTSINRPQRAARAPAAHAGARSAPRQRPAAPRLPEAGRRGGLRARRLSARRAGAQAAGGTAASAEAVAAARRLPAASRRTTRSPSWSTGSNSARACTPRCR